MLDIGMTNDTYKSSTTMHPYFSRFVASTLYQAHRKKRGEGEKRETEGFFRYSAVNPRKKAAVYWLRLNE